MTDQKIEEIRAHRAEVENDPSDEFFGRRDYYTAHVDTLLTELDRLKAHWNGVCEQRTLTDRLRGHYRTAITDGLGPAGGEEPDNPLEHVRTFQVPSIQRAAADRIDELEAELDRLKAELKQAVAWKATYKHDLELAERKLKASGTFTDGIEAAIKAAPPIEGYLAPNAYNEGWQACRERYRNAIRALSPQPRPDAQAQRDTRGEKVVKLWDEWMLDDDYDKPRLFDQIEEVLRSQS